MWYLATWSCCRLPADVVRSGDWPGRACIIGMEQFSKRRSPQATEGRPQVKAASFSGAGHDRVMTSALRGGVLDHPGIPTGLKPQPLRLNRTELNWQPVGSIPVSATNSSYIYGQRVTTSDDALRPRRKLTRRPPLILAHVRAHATPCRAGLGQFGRPRQLHFWYFLTGAQATR